MIRAEVVDYLRTNLPQFPLEELRQQLLKEGVSSEDFEQCLKEAQRPPQAPPAPSKAERARKAAKLLLAFGLLMILAVGVFVFQKPAKSPGVGAAAGSSGAESGFVGANGWVVRLPKDYVGMSEFKDSTKAVEIIHFSKRGTDPTNFLNDGLFGQLGIVRLTVSPSQFPANPTGTASLSGVVSGRTSARGEKFEIKNIQIGTLSGVQVNIQSPFPRVEAYILGRRDLYFFYAGQEDEVWRDIVLSLRDARSED